MEKIIFKCLRCGRCCKNLIRHKQSPSIEICRECGKIHSDRIIETTNGLSLLPEEINRFQKEHVSPEFGVGSSKDAESLPSKIISYQLNLNTCPQFSVINGCRIYHRRPLICKGYPLLHQKSSPLGIVHPDECMFLERLVKRNGPIDNLLPMTPKKFKAPKEWQAIFEMDRKVARSNSNILDRIYVFDLKTKKWISGGGLIS